MDWSDRKVVVVGAGRSGTGAASLLAWLGAEVVLTDAREASQLDHLEDPGADVAVELGGHPESLWQGAPVVVVSPGIPPSAAPVARARELGLRITSEIEVAAGLCAAPAVAITGSNGKSTVTSMVAAILSRQGFEVGAGGNLGTPLSRLVLDELRGDRHVDRYVLELSSFQTEAIEDFRPRWAAVLNVSPDHLDRHRSLRAYRDAKLRLVANCEPEDWLVWGADDPLLRDSLPPGPRHVPFGTADPDGSPAAVVDAGRVRWRDPEGHEHLVVTADELALLGSHNLLNAAAATALACLAGADVEAARNALRDFRGLEHRMEACGELAGVRCVNDSKATNVGATAASLAGLDAPVWLILGGRDKGADFTRLRPLVRGGIRRALLIGEASGKIAASLDGAVPLALCRDMETAVDTALTDARAGDVVLLAPACTSFDQYRDFEHRGDHFKQIIAARRRAHGNEG